MSDAFVHGLSEQTLEKISSVLAGFPQVELAVLFGSRAKGTQRRGSDIDLALFGPTLDWRIIGLIDDAFDLSNLHYSFSLIHRNTDTAPEVAAHIARVGREIYVAPDAHGKASARMETLLTRGAKVWGDVPSAGAWVDELRGNNR